MDLLEMHQRAQSAFAGVLAHVTDDQLGAATPCDEWDVAGLIEHAIAGNLTVAARLGDPTEVNPRSGDRSEDFDLSSRLAHAAFSTEGALDRMVELPFGVIPAGAWLAIRSGDIYAHAWDLATAVGAGTDLDAELGEAVRAATEPILSPDLRGPGRPFGAEQPCAADRPVADRYAALLGREVGS